MTQRAPIVYKDGKHQPLDPNVDQVDVNSIPLSPRPYNTTRRTGEGLYTGEWAYSGTIYISNSGVDDTAPGRGNRATPFQTIDYAISRVTTSYGGTNPPIQGTAVPELSCIGGSVTLALKAGEQFALNNSYQFTGNVILTYWGDVNYGDFDSPVYAGKAYGATMLDLNRPTVQCTVQASSANGITHFKGLDSLVGGAPPTLTLLGVVVTLPVGAASNSDYQDVLTVEAERTCRLQLIGARINKLSTVNAYGALGVHSRGRGIIEQYASQFLVNGTQVQSGAASDVLAARPNFIKFYPERLGNSQLGGTLTGGYTPTGMLTVQWSNCAQELVTAGKSSQPTYPTIGDPSFGLSAYFLNLARDPQARPLNVVCPQIL